jgi:hypothetical protein
MNAGEFYRFFRGGRAWHKGRLTRQFTLVFLLGLAPKAVFAQAIAEGGSPLYAFTVHESVLGLKTSGQDKPAAGQVCPQCGKVHPVASPNGTNQVAALPASESLQPNQPCPICGQIHALAAAPGQTNLAAAAVSSPGASAPSFGKYFYCDKCKVYHLTKPSMSSFSFPTNNGVPPWPANSQSNQPKTAPH